MAGASGRTVRFPSTPMTFNLVLQPGLQIRAVLRPSLVSDSLQPHALRPARQEYWSRVPFPPPGNLPDPGIKSESPLYH